jgi:very-short-patch-repair endonuclease
VLDFFCAAWRLAVEVDGEVHGCGDLPQWDIMRHTWLREQGVQVIRVRVSDVLSDLEAVVRHIVAEGSSGATCPSTAFGGPPPVSGED